MTSRLWFWRGRTAFLAILAAALWMLDRPAASVRSADKPDEPSELDVIPNNGTVILSLHVVDVWNDKGFRPTREKILLTGVLVPGLVVKQFGVAPEEMERLTWLTFSNSFADPGGWITFPFSDAGGWLTFVTTTKPYDRKKVLAALTPDATEDKVKGRLFYANTKGPSIAFLTERTYVNGSAKHVKEFLNRGAGAKDGPLNPALQAARQHQFVIGVDGSKVAENASLKNWPWPQLDAVQKAQTVLLISDWNNNLNARCKLTFGGESEARAGLQGAMALPAIASLFFPYPEPIGFVFMHSSPDPLAEHRERLARILASVRFERSGSVLKASLNAEVSVEDVLPGVVALIPNVSDSRGASANNLKQLALAMYDYHAVYSHFPTAAVFDKNGKPLLSWRVMILPYMEQEALYKQFHLDEPWDGEHNRKLLDKMPPLFAAGDEQAFKQALKKHETHYQTFVGKGAMFDGEKGVKFADVTDGLSNTILIVEAKKAVPWTKPEDVPFDAGKMVPKLGGLFEGIFNAAFADGSVRALPLTIKEEKLRALITRNGGEVVEPDK